MNSEKRIEKKLLSLVLALAMVITMVPMFGVEVYADGEPSVSYLEPTYEQANVATSGVISWTEKHVGGTSDTTCSSETYTVVSDSAMQVTWTAGWYVVNSDVTITGGAIVSGGAVNLILADGCSLTVKANTNGYAGIQVSSPSSLTIYAQSTGTSMGALTATGNSGGAGIGGGNMGVGSNITINGGNVKATGGNNGAGIGGGNMGVGSNITINGGNVKATGGIESAGIGGGTKVGSTGGQGSDITINGGTVTATGKSGGAGIGGGNGGSGINITINGGTVTATAKSDGAGIGGGKSGAGSNITINGGTVTATANSDDAIGKGGSVYVSASNIKVNKTLILCAGTSANPTEVIANNGNDLASSLKDKQYATIGNPLTFTAQEADSSVTFNWYSGSNVMYSTRAVASTEWSNFTTYNAGTKVDLASGAAVRFRGTDVITTYADHFSMSGKIAASGNVTSLTNGVGGDAKLTVDCYSSMFYGCTSLTTAPVLPAIELAENCYNKMFNGCTSLTAPADMTSVSAVADCCCFYMYYNCTGMEIYTSPTGVYTKTWKATSATNATEVLDWSGGMFTSTGAIGANAVTGSVIAGNTYYIMADPVYVCVNTSTSPSTSYTSIQAAIDNVTIGQTIQLTTNVALDATITVSNSTPEFTLDLNGYVLQQTTMASVIKNEGNLTIIDSTYECADRRAHYFTYTSTGAWNWNEDSVTTNAITVGAIDPDTTQTVVAYGGVITGGEGTIQSSTAYGGAIYNDEGTLTISGASIIGNTATATGSNVDIKAYGGGIYNYKGTLMISGASIAGNTATATGSDTSNVKAYGGAIYNDEGTLMISGGSITGNTATATGSNVSEVYADGGGICNCGSDVTMNNVQLVGNVAQRGGGVYNNGNITMNNVNIIDNRAYSTSSVAEGGGIYNEDGLFTISGSSVTGNHATSTAGSANGGAIYIFKGTMTMSAVTVSYNKAIGFEAYGGAIYNQSVKNNSGTINILNSSVTCNIASGSSVAFGGGFINSGSLALNNVIISNNVLHCSNDSADWKTGFGGAGIDWWGGSVTLSGGTKICNNKTNDTIDDNLFMDFNNNIPIIVDGLDSAARIGINHSMTPTSTAAILIASGSGINKNCFVSDDDAYEVATTTGGLVLQVKTVQKQITYSDGGSVSTYTVTSATSSNGKVSTSVSSSASGKTVTLTVTPDKGWTLETITVTDKNGKEITLTPVVYGEKYTFTMPSSNVTVKATFMEDNSMLNYFVDVTASDYFYDAVLWAAENNITSGVDSLHFNPSGITTRAQMVTFLWRAAGCPEPTSTTCKFTDVTAGSYYEKAVIWAIENGITKGISDTTFAPDMTLNRAQTVTFLLRNSGDTASYTHSFSDVPASQYYNLAVAWAAANKITSGITDTTFAPEQNCTRGQVVTFLYRAFNKQ